MTRFLKSTNRNETASRRSRAQAPRRILLPANVVVLGCVLLLGFLYVMLINATATGGYHLKELEGRLVTLEEEGKELTLEMAELTSMARVAEAANRLELVAAAPFEYLTPGSAVATTTGE